MPEVSKSTSTVEIISDPVRFAEVQDQWSDLHKAAGGGPFSSYDWIESWLSVYLNDAIDMNIVVVWNADRLVLGLPLAREHRRITGRLPFKAATLRMLYDDRVGFHDILMRPGHKADMARVLEVCKTQLKAAYMDLTPVKSSDGFHALVAAADASGKWTHTRGEIETGIAQMPDGIEPYLMSLSSNTRKKIRSLERKILKAGGDIQTVPHSGADGSEVLAAALDVSTRSWKAQGGTDIGSQSADRAFFHALYERMATKGNIRIIVTWLDGVAVSSIVDLVQGKTTYGLVCDYDDAYHAQGVGRFGCEESMRVAVAQGSTRYDMLRATHFTRSYCQEFEHYQRLRIALRPGLARWVITGEDLARRAVQALRRNRPKLSGRHKILGARVS